MKRRPLGVTIIAVLYLAGSAGYTALLLTWLLARASVISFIEQATPSASLGPALLENIPGIVTTYFVVMAGLGCWIGIALLNLQRWAWVVTCAFVVLTFVLDFTLFLQMLRHLSAILLAGGILRFGFLVWVIGYLSRPNVRAAFGLARLKAAA
jgi:hypothetical protein